MVRTANRTRLRSLTDDESGVCPECSTDRSAGYDVSMVRTVVIVVLAVASLACLPLHCLSIPDDNQVEFFSWSYGDREKFSVRAVNLGIEFSTWSYLSPSTTPVDFDIGVLSFHRIPLLPRSQPQKRYRGFSVPLIVYMLALGTYPALAFVRGPLRRRRRRRAGLCIHCGYDIHGNESGVCPECGGGCSVDLQTGDESL